jgi:ubiquinone/menaquinone biosynthesis C-methylase UbiE
MNKHAQQAANHFDTWADTFGEDRIAPWFQFYQTLALSKLDLEAGGGFLDVGCGTGWAVRQAAARLTSSVAAGIDISPKMIDKAKKLGATSPRVEFHGANSELIPYPNETFRWVICTCSFHHYENPVLSLQEIKRVMRPGGRFVLIDSARDVFFPIWLQDRFRRYLEKSHIRYYTTREMEALLRTTGMKQLGAIETIRKIKDHGKLFTGLMVIVCEK